MKVYKGETEPMNVEIDIPQGLLILLILFLFFMADLLDAINNEALRTSLFAFIDDTYILIYGNSTERNCRILKRIYREYKE